MAKNTRSLACRAAPRTFSMFGTQLFASATALMRGQILPPSEMKSLYGSTTRSAVSSLLYVIIAMLLRECPDKVDHELRSWPELVIAVLRTAGPVVEIAPLVAAVQDRGESVVTVHDGFDEDQRVVRRAEGGLQVPNGLDDERSRRGIATEHLRKIGIRPVGDVVVRLIFAEVAAFDRISAVVDQENHRLVVVP